ncbi:MAG: hypothetical protein M3162_09350 [Thermoproteota archaeon]|nr:hypothetical protein [Thermoproteota archaeon]
MVKIDKFDKHNGKQDVLTVIKQHIERQGGRFEEQEENKEDKRIVWYLDTQKHHLKDNDFTIRFREQSNASYDLTIKNRHQDRNIAGSYDLSNPEEKNPGFEFTDFDPKFEEDILPKERKFSESTKFKFDKMPKLEAWHDILPIYSNLKNLEIDPTETLLKVNGCEVKETNHEIGKIVFGDENKSKAELSIWESRSEDGVPLIVEFSFVVGSKGIDSSAAADNGNLFDFPQSLVEQAETLYNSLQNDQIMDKETTETKTDYIYKRCRDGITTTI